MRRTRRSRLEVEREREAARRAAPPRHPAREWRVVVNGGPCGEYDEAGARAELEKVIGREVEIPLEYYEDNCARLIKASVGLQRWDGQEWIGVPGTAREIVVDVKLSSPKR